ncbi:hypothetical protein GMA92_05855 [Turicibacter sanguinis]|uniref:Uncharacterized protein n=2 Tax=Turicibacter sanguinis TaxID=154288 RepID=A0A9X5AP21_9FIRM|nr:MULTISPECIES: hypothetical protein [Turicibacter]EFF63359.1 hypothetical protein CUW_1438 [Turicibacter sanguinis PC909]EGC91835.1 hypothetical protein HMPREF9402_2326 [Turicibacter sp. HGF1]MTK20939.1 hypothetical protein [Turicibacter sanguinis]MTK73554.1 hypothetical protein [Turicibacter sanguinis]
MQALETLNSIVFYGKHSDIINKISSTNENLKPGITPPPLFSRVIDAYYIAGLIGVLNNYKSTPDLKGKERTTIFTETLNRNLFDLNFYSAIPIILTQDLTKVSDVKRAFFSESNDEENYLVSRNNIFYNYALGGLEIIDEKILKNDLGQYLTAEDELDIYDRLEQYLSSLEEKYKIDDDFVDIDLIMDSTDFD